ncbi:MAG: transposase [Alphaproteobacteria bacterium]
MDASTIEANAALRAIVRRDSGEGYREMLKRLAKESGIETPTADDLIRMDKKRKGKKLSNEDWESKTDSDARIAKMKVGRTRLGYKPEHAVDLDTGAIVAAPIHEADQGDTSSLPGTLEAAEENLEAVRMEPSLEDPAELVADKGYHSRGGLKGLEDGAWKSRISEPKPNGIHRWKGDDDAKRAYYNNRARLLSEVARQAFKLRAELVERSFAHILDRGGMRRAWLRGRDNLQKRYLVHVSGYNVGLIMRVLTGCGTPRRWAEANIAIIWFSYPINHQTAAVFGCLFVIDGAYRGKILGTALGWSASDNAFRKRSASPNAKACA